MFSLKIISNIAILSFVPYLLHRIKFFSGTWYKIENNNKYIDVTFAFFCVMWMLKLDLEIEMENSKDMQPNLVTTNSTERFTDLGKLN